MPHPFQPLHSLLMSDLHVHDEHNQPIPADEKTTPVGIVPGPPARHVWMTFTKYADLVGATIRVSDRECCGCHKPTPIADVWSVMPVDRRNIICGPGYLYCTTCRFGETPTHAWRHADIEWKKTRPGQRRTKPDIQLDRPTAL